MAKKKLSVGEILFWLIIILWLLWLASIMGCASQARQMPQMDSTHYVAQAQPQGYPCPECGFLIPDKDVSPNIRTKNECPNCRKIFFGKPERKSSKSQNKPHQGPNVLVRGHHSDIKHENNVKYSTKNSWDVSEDGNRGSISSTTIIIGEHAAKGEYGRTIGAAGLGRYGGYGY